MRRPNTAAISLPPREESVSNSDRPRALHGRTRHSDWRPTARPDSASDWAPVDDARRLASERRRAARSSVDEDDDALCARVSGEFVDRWSERAADDCVTRPSACDTAHDSAAATDTPGDSPARRPGPGSAPAVAPPAPHACDARCSTAGTRGASAPDRRPSRTTCGPDIHAARSQSAVQRRDGTTAHTAPS